MHAIHVQTHFRHAFGDGTVGIDLRKSVFHHVRDCFGVEMVAVLMRNQQRVERNVARFADRRRQALEADVFLRMEHAVGKVRVDGEGTAVVCLDQKSRLSQPEELSMTGLRTALRKFTNEIHETKTPFTSIFSPK